MDTGRVAAALRSCFLSRAAWRTPLNPWDTRAPLCVGGVLDCATFSSSCRLPSTTSAESIPPLFGCFIGTTQQSDSSIACTSALRLDAFADRSTVTADALEVSRFSCMLFLDVPGSSTTPRPTQDSRCAASGRYCLPAQQTVSARGSSVIGAQSPGPPMPLSTLRCTPHDVPRRTRGQNGVAAPFL